MNKQAKNQLEFWTIYDKPKDFPGHFVARRFDIRGGKVEKTNIAILAASRQEIDAHFYQNGFTWLPRNSGDEAQIVGSWLR